MGPFIQVPFGRRFGAILGGGLAIVSVNSDFRYEDTVQVAGGPSFTSTGSGSHSDVLVGGYFGGNVYYNFTPAANVFLGYQYQNVGTYEHTVAGKKASIGLDSSVFLTLGVGYSF